MSNKEKLYKVLSNVLGIDIESINDSTGPDNVESWDSFNALMLISEFEEVFDMKFTIPEVEKVRCVKDITAVLKNRGLDFPDD